MIQRLSYMPKGSMCAVCASAKVNCSGLPFQDMPVIGEYQGVKIVRCTLFSREGPDEAWARRHEAYYTLT